VSFFLFIGIWIAVLVWIGQQISFDLLIGVCITVLVSIFVICMWRAFKK